MKILGVDPALKATGYGIIEVSEQQPLKITLLEAGIIAPSVRDDVPTKIQKIHQHLDAIITEHAPTVMVLEKLYAHHKYPATAFIIGHVRGAICLLSAQRNLRLVEHSVKRIRKALLGNGGASKQQTRLAVAQVFKVNPLKLTLDASDALALALGYAHMGAHRWEAVI